MLLHSPKLTANLGQLALQVCRLLGESGHVRALGGKLGFHRPARSLRFITPRTLGLQVVMHLIGPLLQLCRPCFTSRSPFGLRSHVDLKAGELVGQLGGLPACFIALVLSLLGQGQRLRCLGFEFLTHPLQGFTLGGQAAIGKLQGHAPHV